jgi:transcriptional regulator with XRE-family HTH domain
MIKPEQMRAARAYLNWSRKDLAERAGMTVTTIKNIEDADVQPHAATMQAIETVFREHHIEFLPNGGVCRQDNSLRIITEGEPYLKVLEDVFTTLKDTGGEVLFALVRNELSSPAVIESDLRLRRLGIRFRSLIEEGDTYCLYPLKEYRWVPHRFFHNNTQVIYGEKFATMILDPKTGKDASAIIIHNPHIVAAQRNLFKVLWENGKTPKATTAPVTYA